MSGRGIGVRRRTERMLPARGPVLHCVEGQEPAISLLVLGDSSAASVGIGHSENGLAAQLAILISKRALDARSTGARQVSIQRRPDRCGTMCCPTSRPIVGRISSFRSARTIRRTSTRSLASKENLEASLCAASQMARSAGGVVAGRGIHSRSSTSRFPRAVARNTGDGDKPARRKAMP